MAARPYQKARQLHLLPDAQSFLADLTQLRALVADLAARYSTVEPTTVAKEAAVIHSPADVARLVGPELACLEREELRVLLLSTSNRVLDIVPLYKGTLNGSLVRAAEVFKPAVLANAAAIIVVHNHPGADVTPSPEDVRLTTQLCQAGALLDVELLDHVIVAGSRPGAVFAAGGTGAASGGDSGSSGSGASGGYASLKALGQGFVSTRPSLAGQSST
jgi:DNA repair protein RadC